MKKKKKEEETYTNTTTVQMPRGHRLHWVRWQQHEKGLLLSEWIQ